MIEGVFGLPRCGKTTYLQSIAFKERMKIYKGLSDYDRIISTSPLWGAEMVDRADIVDYKWVNTLILIDEISLFFGNREFKEYGRKATETFSMHSHYGNSVIWCTQKVDDVDVKIWALTERLFYCKKGMIFRGISHFYTCPHIVAFNDETKRPIQGFNPPNIFSKLFHLRLRRKKFYSLFDTHCRLSQFDKPEKMLSTYLVSK